MRTILIPTDFSENSTKAIEYAITLFGECESHFVFAHVIPTLEHSPDMLEGITSSLRKDITESVTNQVEGVRDNQGLSELDYEIFVELGEPDIVLQSLSGSVNADIIVMGTQGIGKGQQVTAGTTAVRTIQGVTCPVIVVPEVAIAKKPEAILFASDQEAINEPAIFEPLRSLALKFDSHVSVLNILTEDIPDTGNIQALKKNLNKQLLDVSHSYNFKKFESIVYGLVAAIHDEKVDLLAMISKHHNEMETLIEGSSTATMAIYSDIPLLVIPDTLIGNAENNI